MDKIGSIFPIEGGKRLKGVLTLKDEFGVSWRKNFTGTDPKKIRKKMLQFKEQYNASQPTEGMPVTKMCELAIEVCERRGCAPKTISGYRQILKSHVISNIGAVKITELRAAHVERLMDKMADGGAGPQTQALCRNFLRMAINRVAIKGGFVQVNAAAFAEPPRIRRRARKALEPLDLEKILATEKQPVLRAMWLFLASTGLRPVEARTLLWRDLDEAKDGHWIKLRESKTEEGKQPVPVPSSVMAELQQLPKNSLYVFATSKGAPFDESNLRRAWIKVLDDAEVPYTNLYQLRKLFGTLKARKVSDGVLKRLMRHTDARTTKQYYVGAIEEDLRNAVED